LYSLLQVATNYLLCELLSCTIESFHFHCSYTIKLFVWSIVYKQLHFFCIG